jgi:DNA (cytosine-5)-methyltransferase 1
MKKKTYTLGELFCGPGGLSLGAFSASTPFSTIKHGWSSDYDADSCATYSNNLPNAQQDSVICSDVKILDIASLTAIDAFAYGFPCNDFSLVGEQKGFNGSFGSLYTYGIDVINTFDPLFFIAENVSGITSANSGKAFKKITDDLKEAGNFGGYHLTAHLYKSEYYGVPQTRHRVLIIGFRKDLNLTFKVPTPTHKQFVTTKQALEVPPIPINAFNNELTKQNARVVERLSHIKQGENAWNSDLPEHLKLNVKSAKLSQIYRRLDENKPSYTITGSGGGGTHGYHYTENRALTNRERARLQSFPDNFIFQGSKESVRKQIGMAVPPKLSETVFTAILKTLDGIEYDHIDTNIKL